MSSLPKKGDIIINPKTQRPVKVGSRTWLNLVREGLVEGKYSDPKEIYTLEDGDDEDELINKFNKSLPPNQQAVRGRGKYANKIVKRNKQPSTTETSKYTVQTTARKLKNKEVYDNLQEGGNFEEDLEALIMAELTKMNNYNYDYEEEEKEEEFYGEELDEEEGFYEEEPDEEELYEEDEDEDNDFSEGSFE